MQAAQLTGVDVLTRGEVLESALQARDYLVTNGVPALLAAKDPRLWGRRAVDHSRLGWLDLPRTSHELLSQVDGLVSETRYSGLDNVVLIAMGAEALAAQTIVEDAGGGAALTIVDGTPPLAGVLDPERLDRTFIVMSSKRGAALETEACRRIIEQALRDHGLSEPEIAHRFLVITDHGSPLDAFARERGYRVGLTDPYLPGHYGALSAYGVVPAVLAGAEVRPLLDEAAGVLPYLAKEEANPGLLLGAILGGCALGGPHGVPRDKVVIHTSSRPLNGWLRQLIAAATGKRGRGVLPLDETGWRLPDPGHDLHGIALNPRSPATAGADTSVFGPLGAQFLLWDYAAAAAAWLIGVNPFDGPEEYVTEVENDAAGMLSTGPPLPSGEPTFVDDTIEVYVDPAIGHFGGPNLRDVMEGIVRSVPVNGYLSVVSYLSGRQVLAEGFTQQLAERIRRPVSFESGPSALQGTASYHKDGPRTGVFLVVTGDAEEDTPVPDQTYTLGTLRLARALADVRALRRRRLPVVWLHLRDPVAGTARLTEAV
jgi:glucose-6-phosphate isomerase